MQQLTPLKTKAPVSSGIGTFIVCVILSIAVIFFLVLPKYQQFGQSRAKAKEAKAVTENLKKSQATLNELLVQMNQKKDSLAKVSLAIPTNPDIPEVYAYLETMSKSLNLTLSGVQATDEAEEAEQQALAGIAPSAKAKAAPPVDNGSLGVIDVNLQVAGTLKDYISFLGKLQNSLRLIDVQAVNVTAEEGKPNLKFLTSLKTYYQKPQ